MNSAPIDFRSDASPSAGWLFPSMRGFTWSSLTNDAIAGLLLAAIAIPEQLATARLAGMPPATGLYAFAAGALAFAAFGVNRFLSAGADSTIAPIFAGGLAALAAAGTRDYNQLAHGLALLVGLVLIMARLIRAGWIADLLSIPVTTGFMAGISVHIIAGQLPAILGIEAAHAPMLAMVADIVQRLPSANAYAITVGLGVVIATFVLERMNSRLPAALIALVIAAAASTILHLPAHGVITLGPLSGRLPPLTVPLMEDARNLPELFPLALIIGMICMMQTAAVVRSFPSAKGAIENLDRDFGGMGFGCILAGLIGAFPINASPPRTALVAESGGRSQLASLVAVAVVAALIYFAGQLLAYVPVAALGGILIFIATRIFRVSEMARIARYGGLEIALVALCSLLVVILPIETGMVLSIIVSLMHSLYVVARPVSAELGRVPGTTIWRPHNSSEPTERVPGVLVFAPAGPLNFTNAKYLSEKLRGLWSAAPDPVRLIIIEASGVIDIDYTGSLILQETIGQVRASHIAIALARLSAERAEIQATRSGLIRAFGADHVFKSVEEAIIALGS